MNLLFSFVDFLLFSRIDKETGRGTGRVGGDVAVFQNWFLVFREFSSNGKKKRYELRESLVGETRNDKSCFNSTK